MCGLILFFACICSIFPTLIIDEIILSPLYIFCLYFKLSYKHGFMSGFSIMSYSSVYVFFCHYHIVFIIMTLYFNLKSGSMIPSKFQLTYPKFIDFPLCVWICCLPLSWIFQYSHCFLQLWYFYLIFLLMVSISLLNLFCSCIILLIWFSCSPVYSYSSLNFFKGTILNSDIS